MAEMNTDEVHATVARLEEFHRRYAEWFEVCDEVVDSTVIDLREDIEPEDGELTVGALRQIRSDIPALLAAIKVLLEDRESLHRQLIREREATLRLADKIPVEAYTEPILNDSETGLTLYNHVAACREWLEEEKRQARAEALSDAARAKEGRDRPPASSGRG